MPLTRTRKVPVKVLRGLKADEFNIAKDGNTVKLWTILDGKTYEISLVPREDAPSSGGSGGTTDHGALSGLTDDDHTQYVLRSIMTTKGDLFAYSTAVARLAIGSSGQLLIPDSPSTTGLKWGNLVFNNDELVANSDEIVTV